MVKYLKELAKLKPDDVLFFTAIFLLIVLGAHIVHLDHDHPKEVFGEGIQAALHGEDKKWWLMFLIASISSCVGVLTLKTLLRENETHKEHLHQFPHFNADLTKLFDPLRIAFREGILHPKICQ